MSEQNNSGSKVSDNNGTKSNTNQMQSSRIVDGFCFSNAAEAKQAVKEAEGVKYIKEKTNMDNPEMVLNIYRKMVQQNLFETAVGFAYLKELQEYLQSIPYVRNEDILPIPVKHTTLEASVKARSKRTEPASAQKKEKVQQVVNINYKTKFRVARTISIVLAVCVVGMFAITATTNNTTILNYEQKIINRYEEWENELNEREAIIKMREADLEIETE